MASAEGACGGGAVARGLAQLTGAPLWKIAFWTPAFLGSLTAVVTVFWGWLLAGRRGCIAAGFLGALSPGLARLFMRWITGFAPAARQARENGTTIGSYSGVQNATTA